MKLLKAADFAKKIEEHVALNYVLNEEGTEGYLAASCTLTFCSGQRKPIGVLKQLMNHPDIKAIKAVCLAEQLLNMLKAAPEEDDKHSKEMHSKFEEALHALYSYQKEARKYYSEKA